jgi:two-component sensor histidine kinase
MPCRSDSKLLINAIKYALPNGRPGIIRARLDKSQLCPSVQDNGVGMQDAVQGTGVGLKLAHTLAQQLGGSRRTGTAERVRDELRMSVVVQGSLSESGLLMRDG